MLGNIKIPTSAVVLIPEISHAAREMVPACVRVLCCLEL